MLNDVTEEARRRYLDRSAKGWPLPLMGKRRETAERVPGRNVVKIGKRRAVSA